MSKYNAGHAARARHQFLLDRGREDATIDVRPPDGWLDDGPDRFVCYDRADFLKAEPDSFIAKAMRQAIEG